MQIEEVLIIKQIDESNTLDIAKEKFWMILRVDVRLPTKSFLSYGETITPKLIETFSVYNV